MTARQKLRTMGARQQVKAAGPGQVGLPLDPAAASAAILQLQESLNETVAKLNLLIAAYNVAQSAALVAVNGTAQADQAVFTPAPGWAPS